MWWRSIQSSENYNFTPIYDGKRWEIGSIHHFSNSNWTLTTFYINFLKFKEYSLSLTNTSQCLILIFWGFFILVSTVLRGAWLITSLKISSYFYFLKEIITAIKKVFRWWDFMLERDHLMKFYIVLPLWRHIFSISSKSTFLKYFKISKMLIILFTN